MAAWLKLAAPVAIAIWAVPASALQSGTAQADPYPQILSAAQDCLDSYQGIRIEPKQLKKRGWEKARFDGFGNLGGVITGFARADGAIMLVTGYSCIVKSRLAPPATADGLAAAISEKWAVQPTAGENGSRSWRLADRKIELSPGPADGSNVSVTISRPLEGLE